MAAVPRSPAGFRNRPPIVCATGTRIPRNRNQVRDSESFHYARSTVTGDARARRAGEHVATVAARGRPRERGPPERLRHSRASGNPCAPETRAPRPPGLRGPSASRERGRPARLVRGPSASRERGRPARLDFVGLRLPGSAGAPPAWTPWTFGFLGTRAPRPPGLHGPSASWERGRPARLDFVGLRLPGSAGVPPASGPQARHMAMRAGRPRSQVRNRRPASGSAGLGSSPDRPW